MRALPAPVLVLCTTPDTARLVDALFPQKGWVQMQGSQ